MTILRQSASFVKGKFRQHNHCEFGFQYSNVRCPGHSNVFDDGIVTDFGDEPAVSISHREVFAFE